ncbi:MAG: hydrogenase maturation nickel metallochaperone HypA [Bacteroidetes bacterium]|jgi:hydrogenase nickel incorporation protein HypA/HybF|nr:hydrogenase maturation nickel metallochaperone HypA [Bacteroidota bacterium]
MHEISLVKSIFNSLDKIYTEKEIEKIQTIHLTLGELSNAQPILMKNAFEAVVSTERKDYSHCKLEVSLIPILIHCSRCEIESEIKNYKFVCKSCGLPNNNIVQGEELLVSGVDIKD